MSWESQYPHVAAAYQYCLDVTDGKVPACKWVNLACQRQLDDLDTATAFTFDAAKAEAVCTFISKLPHVKGSQWAGKTIDLEPWQAFTLTTPFGWVYRHDVIDDANGDVIARSNTRRFRTVLIMVPRKNAKSTIAAGVGLYMLTDEGELGAEVYSSATTRAQAKIVWQIARQQAMRTPALKLGIQMHSLQNLANASVFEALHAQGETLDGYNISAALNDELHAWSKRQVYGVIETAMGSRDQPMIWNVSTAGFNLDGVCFELQGYLQRVLEKTIADESFFGLVYGIDEGDDWTSPASHRKANPNYGVSVSPLDMNNLCAKATEMPSEQNDFLTKRLNVWCNAATAWMNMQQWQAGHDSTLRIEDFKGEPCWLGIDLASKIDINSMAILFKRGDHIYCFMRHWLPEAAITSDNNSHYDGWVRMGALRSTPGNVIDVDVIEAETAAISDVATITEIAMDPGHNSTQYGVHMVRQGYKVIDVRPTVMEFSEPMKWLEAYVKDGTFHHNCPVLTWMVSNVEARRDQKDNIYPRKPAGASNRKIDGVVALLMALNRLKASEGVYDVYADHELLIV